MGTIAMTTEQWTAVGAIIAGLIGTLIANWAAIASFRYRTRVAAERAAALAKQAAENAATEARRAAEEATAELKKQQQSDTLRLRDQIHVQKLTDEDLAASFRNEIREELSRMRKELDESSVERRALENENLELRKRIAAHEIDIHRLNARIQVLTEQVAYYQSKLQTNGPGHGL